MNLLIDPPGAGRLRPYRLPGATRGRLDNGLTLLHAGHGGMPLMTMVAVLDAGTIREAPVQAGLASLMADTLDAGAGGRSGEELAWEIERLGLELAAEATWDASWLTATVAVERFDDAMALVADIIRRPTFPESEVLRVRGEALADILQRRKDPRALANDLILHFLYGDQAPYGRPANGLPERLRSLAVDEVGTFHATNVVPVRTSLVMVGDLDAERARDAAASWFGDWPVTGQAGEPPPLQDGTQPTAVHVVDRPGSVQSEIRAGHAGVERSHPDYFALRVMNTLLGGAFTSRLNLNLRERHGFTYGVRSGFAFRRAPGPFIIQTAVATEVTDRAIHEILHEVSRLRESGATHEEVDNARDYLAGVLPLELQTTEQVAARFADLVLYDLPDDYYQGYREAIRAVSADDVARVAREHLNPERTTFCVVGDARAIREPLATLGIGDVQVHRVPD
jgi:zinc protease